MKCNEFEKIDENERMRTLFTILYAFDRELFKKKQQHIFFVLSNEKNAEFFIQFFSIFRVF